MSCELKNSLIKEFTEKFDASEGQRIGESLYNHIFTPSFKRWFGDFEAGKATKGRADMKNGLPTKEVILEYLDKQGLKAEKDIPSSYINLISKYTPVNPTSVREDLIQQTEALLKKVAKEVGDYAQTKTQKGSPMQRQRKQKAAFRTKIESLLTKLRTYKTEAGLIEYVSQVKQDIAGIKKALKLASGKDVNTHYEYLKRLRYFAAIEDVVYVIDKNPKLKKEFAKNKIDYSHIAADIQNLKKELSEKFIDVLGEKWGEIPGKMTRLAREKYRRGYSYNEAWRKSNPGKSKADFKKMQEAHIDKMIEQNEVDLQQAEKDHIKKAMLSVSDDISWMDAYFGNPRDITDDLIQIAVELLDKADYLVMRETINKTKEAHDLFERFKVGRNTKNMVKLYEDLLAFDEKGKPTNYLVGPIKGEYFKKLSDLYQEKRLAIEEHGETSEQAINAKRKEKVWINANSINGKRGKPRASWQDPKYKYFEDKSNKGQATYDMYWFLRELAEKRDKNYLGHGAGLRLPAIEKSILERTFENNIVDTASRTFGDTFRVRATDVELHNENPDEVEAEGWRAMKEKIKRTIYVNLDEQQKISRSIPTYFRDRSKVKPGDQSYDLVSMYLLDYWGSINYKEKYSILPELEIFKESIATRKTVQKTFTKQTQVAKKLGMEENVPAVIKGEESNAYKAIQTILEDRVYGIKSIGNATTNKIAQSLMSFTGDLFLIGNYFSAGASLFQGKTMNFIKAVGGIDFNLKDVTRGELKYDADVINMIGDIGALVPTSRTNLLGEIFESTQDWSAVAKKFAGTTKASQLANKNTLHFLTGLAENYIQNTLMYSFLNGIKVKNEKGEYINTAGEVVKDKKDAMSLDEAYEKDKSGKRLVMRKDADSIELNTGQTYSLKAKDLESTEFTVKRYLNHLNRRLNGNYALNNQAMAQRAAMGKLAFMLRKWLEPGIRRRYRGIGTAMPGINMIPKEHLTEEDIYYNREIQDLDEGTYTTVLRFLGGLKQDTRKFSMELTTERWHDLSLREQANIKEMVTEFTALILSSMGAALLYGAAQDEPDEKQKWALYMGAFYTRRLYSELFFYTNPREALRILKSPAASLSLIQNGMEIFDQFTTDAWSVATGGQMERYQSGKRKGELKFKKEINDIIPISYQLKRDVEDTIGWLYKPVD
jgi:hypothetical protein